MVSRSLCCRVGLVDGFYSGQGSMFYLFSFAFLKGNALVDWDLGPRRKNFIEF